MFEHNSPQGLAYMFFMSGFVTGFVFALIIFVW